MRKWPLRLKVALWSALVVALTLAVFAVGTAFHFYHEDIELLDRLLQREVSGVFAEIDRLPRTFDTAHGDWRAVLPAAYRHRHVQIWRAGVLVYSSTRATAEVFGGSRLAPGQYSLRGARRVRLAVVQRGDWQVRVAFDMHDLRDSVTELVRGFLIALPLLLLISALGCWWIARQALAPIEAVTRAAQAITAESLHERVPVPAGLDEIHRLALVLNSMIARLESSFLQAQRFCADTSHELRTPLAVIRAGLEAILSADELTAPQERQVLDLLDAATSLSSLSEKLLLLARADAGHLQIERQRFDLGVILREAIEEAAIFAEAEGITIRSELPTELIIQGDAARMMQVLRNLLENAVKYNRPGGSVVVHLAQQVGRVRLAITNTGAGLDASQAARLFERFFRAEAHRTSTGHGLGLNIAREIVRAHGGELQLESHEVEAVTFAATLPT